MFPELIDYIAHWFSDSALWVLFISGFLSATLLPGGSEAGLIATLALNQWSVITVVTIATIGNTLGGMTNYWIGILLPNRTKSEKHGHNAQQWLTKFGYPVLLFSWLPIIGDPLCLAAGWLRFKFFPSLILIAIGKCLRYALIALIYFGFI